MKKLLLVLLAPLMIYMTPDWKTDFEKAKDVAKKEHKHILLNFSGSDWCSPCMRTTKDIFKKQPFTAFADTNLVLVNADFPRLKKNKLTKEQTKENEKLAELYNKKGVFPLTLLLNEDGKVLKQWVGYPGVTPDKFVEQIKIVENAD